MTPFTQEIIPHAGIMEQRTKYLEKYANGDGITDQEA